MCFCFILLLCIVFSLCGSYYLYIVYCVTLILYVFCGTAIIYIFYLMFFFFFFKQKTAYEMRISDGSSDVCSSDLRGCRSWPLGKQMQSRRAANASILE